MRFAERPTVEVEVEVAAPAGLLWPLVTDITLPARFSAELQDTGWVDGAAGPALGARFRGTNRRPDRGDWETTSTVTAYEVERRFGWVVGDLTRPSATWAFELEPAPHGRTVLRERAELGPGPSGLTAAIDARPDKEERIIARRLADHEQNMRATVEGIKALAEGAAG